jgi:hydroxymethylpyrimidine/phosphomethylpyrimidine kinase
MEAVLTDIGADAVKIGMLFSADLIEAVACQLEKHAVANIVLDPVMVAQSGDKLLQDSAIEAIKRRLIPLVDIITPNLPEAEVLLNRKIGATTDMAAAARDLAGLGCRSVLVKGGHLEDNQSADVLYMSRDDTIREYTTQRVDTHNNHGTGCTLSSAIAAQIARGNDVPTAVDKAKNYITSAIQAGAHYSIGKGSGPVHHFFEFWT